MKKRALGTLTLVLLIPSFVLGDHAININTADKDALMTLTGIGEVKAQAIIDYRATTPFTAKEDIQNVSGIGPSTYEGIKDHITVSGSVAPPTQSPSPAPTPSSTPSASPSPNPTSRPTPPAASLFADAGGDRAVIVGIDVEFTGRAYDARKQPTKGARYRWNFGDGEAGEGSYAIHRYEYPGRYAVVLAVSAGKEDASERIIVNAEEANLKLETLPDGGAAITNHAKNDIDLSGWIIRSGEKEFFLPPNSLILGGQTMRLSRTTLGFSTLANTELRFPSGALAYHASVEDPESIQGVAESTPLQERPLALSESHETEIREEDNLEDSIVEEIDGVSVDMAAAASVGESSYTWWLGALGIALFGTGAIYAARRFKKHEWNIIDESGDS